MYHQWMNYMKDIQKKTKNRFDKIPVSYGEEGKKVQKLSPGDIVVIPANVKHWHGARKDSWFSHIAVEVPGEGTSNEWLEPITDEEYNKIDNQKKWRFYKQIIHIVCFFYAFFKITKNFL